LGNKRAKSRARAAGHKDRFTSSRVMLECSRLSQGCFPYTPVSVDEDLPARRIHGLFYLFELALSTVKEFVRIDRRGWTKLLLKNAHEVLFIQFSDCHIDLA